MRKLLTIIAAVFLGTGLLFIPSATASSNSASTLSGCFNHEGVQIPGHTAFECIKKDSDEDGALYWQANRGDYEWNLHPDSSNLVVNAITTRFDPGFNPYYSFTAVVADPKGYCEVMGAGYDQKPTECTLNGSGQAQVMTSVQQASYNDFAEYMKETVPDCSWMPTGTAVSKTC